MTDTEPGGLRSIRVTTNAPEMAVLETTEPIQTVADRSGLDGTLVSQHTALATDLVARSHIGLLSEMLVTVHGQSSLGSDGYPRTELVFRQATDPDGETHWIRDERPQQRNSPFGWDGPTAAAGLQSKLGASPADTSGKPVDSESSPASGEHQRSRPATESTVSTEQTEDERAPAEGSQAETLESKSAPVRPARKSAAMQPRRETVRIPETTGISVAGNRTIPVAVSQGPTRPDRSSRQSTSTPPFRYLERPRNRPDQTEIAGSGDGTGTRMQEGRSANLQTATRSDSESLAPRREGTTTIEQLVDRRLSGDRTIHLNAGDDSGRFDDSDDAGDELHDSGATGDELDISRTRDVADSSWDSDGHSYSTGYSERQRPRRSTSPALGQPSGMAYPVVSPLTPPGMSRTERTSSQFEQRVYTPDLTFHVGQQATEPAEQSVRPSKTSKPEELKEETATTPQERSDSPFQRRAERLPGEHDSQARPTETPAAVSVDSPESSTGRVQTTRDGVGTRQLPVLTTVRRTVGTPQTTDGSQPDGLLDRTDESRGRQQAFDAEQQPLAVARRKQEDSTTTDPAETVTGEQYRDNTRGGREHDGTTRTDYHDSPARAGERASSASFPKTVRGQSSTVSSRAGFVPTADRVLRTPAAATPTRRAAVDLRVAQQRADSDQSQSESLTQPALDGTEPYSTVSAADIESSEGGHSDGFERDVPGVDALAQPAIGNQDEMSDRPVGSKQYAGQQTQPHRVQSPQLTVAIAPGQPSEPSTLAGRVSARGGPTPRGQRDSVMRTLAGGIATPPETADLRVVTQPLTGQIQTGERTDEKPNSSGRGGAAGIDRDASVTTNLTVQQPRERNQTVPTHGTEAPFAPTLTDSPGERLMSVRTGDNTSQTDWEADMPSLTLRTNRPVESGSQESRRESRRRRNTQQSTTKERVTETEPPVEPAPSAREDDQRRGGAQRRTVEESENRFSNQPPAGRETSTLYPDLTVKTLAPRVDVTHSEDRRRDITHRPAEDTRSSRQSRESDLSASLGSREREASALSADVDRVVETLYREIERKMRTERERRGL